MIPARKDHPWTLNQVRDWPGGPVRWQLALDVTAAQVNALGIAWNASGLRASPYSGGYTLSGIDVSVPEAVAIANGADPVSVLLGLPSPPKRKPGARLVVRMLSMKELTGK